MIYIFIFFFLSFSSLFAASYIDYGEIFISSNIRGYIEINPFNNQLNCQAMTGDIACMSEGKAAEIQLYGKPGQIVHVYCPPSASINIKKYGRLYIDNIQVLDSVKKIYCTTSNALTMTTILQGSHKYDTLKIGGRLNIENITIQNANPSYFKIRIIYQ